MTTRHLVGSLVLALLCLSAVPAGASSIVLNGSFEAGAWVDTTQNYMQLGAGNPALTDWTVVEEVVWGMTLTGDGHYASHGDYFLDLSSFGATSVGEVAQVLTTTPGQGYLVSLASAGVIAGIDVDGMGLTPFVASPIDIVWSTVLYFFNAVDTSTLLRVYNPLPGAEIIFVDDLSVTPMEGSPIPEPVTMWLVGGGLAGLAARRRLGRRIDRAPSVPRSSAPHTPVRGA